MYEEKSKPFVDRDQISIGNLSLISAKQNSALSSKPIINAVIFNVSKSYSDFYGGLFFGPIADLIYFSRGSATLHSKLLENMYMYV